MQTQRFVADIVDSRQRYNATTLTERKFTMAVMKRDRQIVQADRKVFTRSGAGAGAFLGIVVGGTIWTHEMTDMTHLVAAIAILLFCAVFGWVIGLIVASIEPEQS
jgi:hypothetical protein